MDGNAYTTALRISFFFNVECSVLNVEFIAPKLLNSPLFTQTLLFT